MADQFKDLGNKAFQANDFEKSIEHFSEAIKLDGNNNILYSNRSASYAKLNKWENAFEDAKKCVDLNPKWAKGYSRLGAALHGLGKLKEAAMAYKQGLEIEPNNEVMRQGLQDVTVAATRPNDQMGQIFASLFSGNVLEKVANHPETKEFLKQPDYVKMISMIQQNPSSINAFMNDKRIMATLGMLAQMNMPPEPNEEQPKPKSSPRHEEQSHQGHDHPHPHPEQPKKEEPKKEEVKKEEVKKEEVKKEEPKKEQPKKEEPKKEEPTPMDVDDDSKKKAEKKKDLGNAAYKNRKFEDALKLYDEAIELDSTNLVFYSNKAAVYFEMQKYKECIETCEKGIEEGRNSKASYEAIAKAYARIGNAYLKLEDFDKALEAFNSSNTEFRTQDVTQSIKKIEKQIEERNRLSYIDKDKSTVHKEKGNEFFRNSQFVEAKGEYDEAIKRNPSDPSIYANRAACFTKLGAFPEGLKDCDEALKLDPKYVKAYTRKGHLLFWMKNYKGALEVYEEGVKLDPQNKELNDGLSRTISAIKQETSGLSDKERIERASKDPVVQEILSDPVMIQILEQMKQTPGSIKDHLKNPLVAKKIQTLVDAGILRFG